jgi:hypothetical protein
MGANDRINHYPERHTVTDEERRELRLRDLIKKKWLKRRDEIAVGDAVAIREAKNDLMTYFMDSQDLGSLIQMAVTNPSDVIGREFLRILKTMITADASIEAEIELGPKPSRRPLGSSMVAGLDAVGAALAVLEE